MKAAVLHAPGEIRIEERERPRPGPIAPRSSASSISERATRSLTEPVGLCDSSLAQIRTPGRGESRLSSTSGVFPIAWTMSP